MNYYEFYVGSPNGYSKFFETEEFLDGEQGILEYISKNKLVDSADIKDVFRNGNGYATRVSKSQYFRFMEKSA